MFLRKFRWLLVVLCMFGIFMMSHLDSAKSGFLTGEILTIVRTGTTDQSATFEDKMIFYDQDETWSQMIFLRKLAHFLEYAVLAVLLTNALMFSNPINSAVSKAMVISVSYGILDELHQLFVPGRTCSISDMLLNAAGVLTGCVVIYVLASFRKAQVYGG